MRGTWHSRASTGEIVRGRPLAHLKRTVGTGLHRVDQEVGNVDALKGLLQSGAGDGVAGYERHVGPHAGRAVEAADLVPVAEEAGYQARPHVSIDPNDEDVHVRRLPTGRG